MTDPNKAHLNGVFAAVLTPQTTAGAPDIAALAGHCRWMLAIGANGLAVLGTTSEANSFTVDERLAVLDGLAEAGVPAQAMMPGTGCCAIGDTVRLTRRALANGSTAVLALPPFYYKGVSDDGLFAAFSEVIEKVGESRLKLYVYHFPQMSGVPISFALIERLLNRYPGTVAGMKDSSGSFENMAGAAKRFPGFEVFSGDDTLFYPLLKEGGVGCITACANVASPLLAEIWAAWRAGDTARAEAAHQTVSAVRKLMSSMPLVPALKETMALHTGRASWRRVRPPLMPLDAPRVATLKDGLKGINYTMPQVS